ncbi:MAG TPA: carboxypeptidase regulatory-like domain-containing protein [Terracidiphilus sp.]|nr:carboxypeptidase regulatory-like domain-containing protein [Terracidiphilus sp.]
MRRTFWGWMLVCIFSFTTFAYSQSATTSLRGTITDPSGALVPGATITITNQANGTVLSSTANSTGLYAFPQIPPAKYVIKVTAAGFGDQSKSATLLVNQPATINFTLSVQSNAVTVDVSATAQTLNTSDASLGNSVGNQMIEAIPTETRNVPDLLALQPGVLALPYTTTDSRSGAVNGGRSDQGNITIDGIDDNDQVGGYAFTGVLRQTQDSIEEFRVVTSNATADAGRSSGAQVSMVTKSGTNQFHGAVYEYHRPTFTVANDWFNKQAQINSGEPNIPGKLIRNIFGGDLGGPILKDKLFFFANYEGKRQAENTQVNRTVPTASYQAGNIVYPYDKAGDTSVYTASDIATFDNGCQVCNTSTYSPGPGPNPNALALFNSMPAANGTLLGDGLNEGSYSFSSHHPVNWDTYIAKIDFVPNDQHRIFVRGQLQKDVEAFPEQFPGQGPSHTQESNNKGLMGGDTWTITPHLINDLRFGYVRQGISDRGVGSGDYVSFRFLSNPTAQTRTTFTDIPVYNLVDNMSWIKGNHTIQFGFNWRLIFQNNSTDANSYNSASTNPYWVSDTPEGANNVDGGFQNSYEIAFANLVGIVPSRNDVFNYRLDSATSGTLLADGAVIDRHFKSNEYEGYLQDSWRVKPNLTITYGLRYTLLQTPWETHGQQVTPTIDTHSWYMQREAAAQAGQIYEEDLTFAPAGHFYNKPGYWPQPKGNFAPRIAIAYSPDTKTSIRLGAGIYYDHFGQALVSTFDQNGSFGMSSSVNNPASVYQIEGDCADISQCSHPGAPRFLGRNILPAIPTINGAVPTTATFPYTAPQDNFAITWGLDNKLQTPYSESFDLSVQRELPAGFTVETSYVGRLGRHLLQQLDLAEPVNYVDPQGGGDYFTAGTQLSKVVDQNQGCGAYSGPDGCTPPSVAAIPYFENVFPFMANLDYDGESATQAIYDYEWAPYRYTWGATTSLSDIDASFLGYYDFPADWKPHFWQDQFSSLYSLASIGMSYYNAGQVTLRHPMSHGLAMDFSYTYSSSIDMGSDAERNNLESSGTAFSYILNTWNPALNRAPSDFDTRHLITADYLYQLPFGRGKLVGSNMSGVMDQIVGGWQLSGDAHWSSGLPFSLFEPGWTTNWEIESYGVVTGKVKTHKHIDSNGNPQYFDDPGGINSGVYSGSPVRLPYPGEAGQRNNFRGDGYFNIDSGLAKSWKIADKGALKFAWEVYNVTNSVRFDSGYIGSGLTGGNLGVATSTLTQTRRMQFALRYDF